MLNVIRRSTATIRSSDVSSSNIRRRWFGGHDHHQPQPQSMQAELWQGHPKHEEGFERITEVTYAVATVLICVALGLAPDTSIQTWANNEAKARMQLKASGKVTEFEFGKHYNTAENMFNFEALDQKGYYDPFDEDGDDEEEEEEEEED